MFTIENFIAGFQTFSRYISVEQQEEQIRFTRSSRLSHRSNDEHSLSWTLPVTVFKEICENLHGGYTWNGSMLTTDKTFEIAVQELGKLRIPFLILSDRGFCTVNEHNYQFTLNKASKEYIFSTICHLATNNECELGLGQSGLLSLESNSSIDDIFDTFKIITVKIKAPVKHSLAEYKRMLHSYLFNISYNLNITLSILDFSESRQRYGHGRTREGQLFPYKEYNQELSKYYQQALATDIPFTQYLAYYHVAEFFFQTISQQAAFKEIQDFITRPSFSPHRNVDIKHFYTMITRKMREQREDGVWNEKTGLLLCLKEYVPDISTLKAAIQSIDPKAIGYYENETVEFANESKTINFDDDTEVVYSNIRDRVYSVRNAIVHSKDGDKLRYEPFKHDKQLAREIALIRGIAEEIIINAAKPIVYNFSE